MIRTSALAFLLASQLCLNATAGDSTANKIYKRAHPLPGTSLCQGGANPDVNGFCPCPAGKGKDFWREDGAYCLPAYRVKKNDQCKTNFVKDKQPNGTLDCVWNHPGNLPVVPVKGRAIKRTWPEAGTAKCEDGSVSEVSGRCTCPKDYRSSDDDQRCVTYTERRKFGCAPGKRDANQLCPCLPGFVANGGIGCIWMPDKYADQEASDCPDGQKAVAVKDATYYAAYEYYKICIAAATKTIARTGPSDSSFCDDGANIEPSGYCPCPANYMESADGNTCKTVVANNCKEARLSIHCVPDSNVEDLQAAELNKKNSNSGAANSPNKVGDSSSKKKAR